MIQRIALLNKESEIQTIILPSVHSVDCLLSGVAEGSPAAAEDSVEDAGSFKSREEV